jgi:hypothetical protein
MGAKIEKDTDHIIKQLDELSAYTRRVQTEISKKIAAVGRRVRRAQREADSAVFEPQSGVTDANTGTATNLGMQNLRFTDASMGHVYDMPSVQDETRLLQDSNDVDIGNFFSRPVKIAEIDWPVGGTLIDDINPWELFFENPRVANRITNFKLLRADMHVKILINGNGFHYGRAMVNYLPMRLFDDMSTNDPTVRQDLVQASQQPHIFLNPTTSAGGEMILPFFYHKNYMTIPTRDWREMGELQFRNINPLRHANDATDNVTITVLAWAENVSLSIPTSRDITSLSPQSGFEAQSGKVKKKVAPKKQDAAAVSSEIDEANKGGMISGPATMISGALAAAAPLTGGATAGLAAGIGAVGKIAKTLGYCRPPVTKDPEPLKPKAVSSLALTTTPDGVEKLTVDDKQFLGTSQEISGIGEHDPLNILDIAKRESYLTSFVWPQTGAPESLLWNCRVQPQLFAQPIGNTKQYHLTSLAYASLPFEYWTGTLNFRFQVVVSAFHKGRLKIVYDPEFLDATPEYNVNYIEIVDIAEKSDFTVSVSNTQDTSLLRMYSAGPYDQEDVFRQVRYQDRGRGNGVLGVYIVNELTTPNSIVTADIEVNVFVSAGDDFQVFVPNEQHGYMVTADADAPTLRSFEPQSGEAEHDANEMSTDGLDDPEQEEATPLTMVADTSSGLNLVFTGEAIASLRPLMKRYNLHTAVGLYDTTPTIVAGSFPAFPYLRGAVAGAVNTTSGGAPYNYCNTVMLHWATLAFSGWRGGVRWKWLRRGAVKTNETLYVQRRGLEGPAAYNTSSTDAPTYQNAKQAAQDCVLAVPDGLSLNGPYYGARGEAFISSAINPNLEFECPYYSDVRFTPGKPNDYTSVHKRCERYDYQWLGEGDQSSVYHLFCAAAEDFQVYFYTGPPRLYYEPGAAI